MMQTDATARNRLPHSVEFEAEIHNRTIEIPAEQWEALAARAAGERVHVIVLATERTPPAVGYAGADLLQAVAEKGYASAIDYLLDHPLAVDDPKPLSRDELYDRTRR